MSTSSTETMNGARQSIKCEKDFNKVQSFMESFATEEATMKVTVEKLTKELEVEKLLALAPALYLATVVNGVNLETHLWLCYFWIHLSEC